MEPQRVTSQGADFGTPITTSKLPGRYFLRTFRWVISTSWFLFLLAAILVGASLLLSLHTDAWHWFQRSGALIVSIGAVLSTRRALGLLLEGMLGDDIARGRIEANRTAWLSDKGELRTCVCGFLFVAMGTLIWAYGDLLGCLLHWNSSCLG